MIPNDYAMLSTMHRISRGMTKEQIHDVLTRAGLSNADALYWIQLSLVV